MDASAVLIFRRVIGQRAVDRDAAFGIRHPVDAQFAGAVRTLRALWLRKTLI